MFLLEFVAQRERTAVMNVFIRDGENIPVKKRVVKQIL